LPLIPIAGFPFPISDVPAAVLGVLGDLGGEMPL
jgi:hypothetical protein